MVLGTVTGAMFLLIFRYVFGGAIDAGPVPYVDFLVPGYIVTSVLFTGGDVAVGFADDLEKGVTDRFRSLPVSPAAAGRSGRSRDRGAGHGPGDHDRHRLRRRVPHPRQRGPGAGRLRPVRRRRVHFMWVFALLGLVSGNAQAAQGMSMMVFPLAFVSSAMVPVATMPGFLQPIAEHQPVTVMINAVRSLGLGDSTLAGVGQHTTAYWVGLALVWCAVIVLAFAPLAVRRYRKA